MSIGICLAVPKKQMYINRNVGYLSYTIIISSTAISMLTSIALIFVIIITDAKCCVML